MKQIRVERPKRPGGRADSELLPRDPRDPDIVRAKALGRAQPYRKARQLAVTWPTGETTNRSAS
jgi:hypothetical protein